jgi:CubicO group peptidase (beta-lactamase class C family)
MKTLTLFTVLLTTVLTSCTVAPPRPSNVASGDYALVRAYLSQLIPYEMKKHEVTGLSIAVVDDQRIIWAEGFGYADQEHQVPASAQTLYRVGSISKLFTDTAIMHMAETGQLNIDRPLQDYLPDFAIKSHYSSTAPITLRELMTHHAGLPRDKLKGFMGTQPESFVALPHDLHETYLAYPPGRIFSYSNIGISLLGDVIQKQFGMPYATYMQQALLAPLGMSHSSFDVGPAQSVLMAKGYRDGELTTDPGLRDVPAGGLNTSVIDMSHFISMMFAQGMAHDHRILKPETVAQMLRPQNTNVPLDLNFQIGLGWILSTLGTTTIENAGLVAYHSGGTILFHSQLYILPEHKLGVIVLANSSSAGQVVDHVATEALTLALEAKSGIRQPPHSKVLYSNKPITESMMNEYVGDYTTLVGYARLYPKGHGLRVDAAGKTFDLSPRSDGLFGLRYAWLGLFPINLGTLGEIGFEHRRLDGRDLLIAKIGKQEFLAGQRLGPTSDIGPWTRRLGNYEITNLGTDHKFIDHIRLLEDHDHLLIETRLTANPGQPQRIVLKPLNDHEAILLGPLADGGDTVRIVKVNGEERVEYSGYLLKKVLQ